MDGKCLSLSDNLKFVILSGKGGVGKTTCASAIALHNARRGQKTLLASTDPAHSLGDSLNQPVGSDVVSIDGVDNLFALEIDANESLKQYKDQYGAVLKEIVYRGTYFNREDINGFFTLSLPGLDELMGIMRLMEFLESKEYDVIVLDTAPTGHTIRLLGLPEQMEEWLRVLDQMMEKHRYMASVFGNMGPDAAEEFIKSMTGKVNALKKLLADRVHTQFVPVMIPEEMSLNETAKLLKVLKQHDIPVTQMIINRVSVERKCDFCRNRKADQTETLSAISRRFNALKLVHLPLLSQEVRGLESLTDFAERLFVSSLSEKEEIIISGQTNIETQSLPDASRLRFKLAESKYIIVGGKGGVGKTSVAASMGLHLAYSGKKTLVFSTDPAHSLSDSFGCEIGNKVTALQEKIPLYGCEIDPSEMLDEIKRQYVEEIEELFDDFIGGTGIDISFDRKVMEDLISLTPPGIDEIMSLVQLLSISENEDFDVIILDTAPTGHLIRLLELPNMAKQWFRKFFMLVLENESMVKMQKTIHLMRKMHKGVRKIQSTFTDPEQTVFVGVTTLEAMVISETESLLTDIKRLGLDSKLIVVNMVMPATECRFCTQMRVQQQMHLSELRGLFDGYETLQVPLFSHQVKGIDNLIEMARLLFDRLE